MSPQELREIKAVFEAALQQPEPERSAYVQNACRGNVRLQHQVEEFLRLSHEDDALLDATLAELLGLRLREEHDPVADALAPGSIVDGRFTIDRILSASPNSTVYCARDEKLYKRQVILKVEHCDRTADGEARALSAVHHPAVPGILESGELHDGQRYVVVEHVTGSTLREALAPGPMSMERAIRIVRQLCMVLTNAHENGIWHLDIKPENVILTDAGTQDERVSLIDFGLSSIAGGSSKVRGGSPAYMPPEQARGAPTLQSDIYALGVTVFEMLTGAAPRSTIASVRSGAAKSARRRIPKRVLEVIDRAMAENPGGRYPSVRDFIGELETAGRRAARSRFMLIASVATAVAMAALTVYFFRGHPGPQRIYVPASQGQVQFQSLSPDGRNLFYVGGNDFFEYSDIYAKDLINGYTRAFTVDHKFKKDIAISRDGKYVAFFRDLGLNRLQLVAIPAAGGREHTVFAGYIGLGGWGSDASSFVLSHSAGADESPHLIGLNLASGQTWDITQRLSDGRGDTYAALSPDGTALAFVRREARESADIYLLAMDARMRPAGTPKRLTSRRTRMEYPQWSADGKELIFAAGTLGNYGLYRVAADGSSEPREILSPALRVHAPTWAPRAGRLAFLQGSDRANVFRAAFDAAGNFTTAPLKAFRDREEAAAYSPDGRSMAVISWRSGEEQVWIADSNGDRPRQLTFEHATDFLSGLWLPDSSGVVVNVGARSFGIRNYLYEPLFERPREIPELQGIPFNFSRDGRWLYYAAVVNGRNELFKYSLESRRSVQAPHASGVGYAMESLDGKEIYFSKSEQEPGLWKMPASGGPGVQVLPRLARRYLFDIGAAGLFYVGMGARSVSIRLLRASDGKDIELHRMNRAPGWQLNLSPDGRHLLYSQYDAEDATAYLIDKFR